MKAALRRIRELLFGAGPGARALVSAPLSRAHLPRSVATSLIHEIAHGGVRALNDDRLMALIDLLLASPGLRAGLRGNARFLTSVSVQYAKKGHISQRQRQGLLNVLERAYPHNLAAELRYL